MKILLINPPFVYPRRLAWVNLGIAYLGSVLKKAGQYVIIRDFHTYSWRNVEAEIKKIEPDVVGISCLTQERSQALRTAQKAKKACPNAKILMGGPHATFCPEHMLQLAPVDAVVMGEGEITIVELINALENDKNLSEVKGIAFKRNGEIVRTEPRPHIKDLDSIPFPMYDDFDLRQYRPATINKEYQTLINTYIVTSRGCPYSCQFCSTSRFWGRVWRARSPQNVVDEVEWLYNDYNVRHLYFFDDIFTLNKPRAIEICQEILKRKLDIKWETVTRIDHIDKEIIDWLKKAGCYRINFGIESGSPKILETINKRFTVEQIREGYRLVKEAGLQSAMFLMVGNPGEDKNTINETIGLVNDIKYPGVIIGGGAITMVFPNTPLYELAQSKGIITDDFWLTDRPYPFYTGDHSVWKLTLLMYKLDYGIRSRKEFVKRFIKENIGRLRSLPFFVRLLLHK